MRDLFKREDMIQVYVFQYVIPLFIIMLSQQDKSVYQYFLTPQEERMLCRHYESILREFCRKFFPPMPKTVTV